MADAPSFTCPECGATSHNPNDVREKYCGACHWWTGIPSLAKAVRLAERELGATVIGTNRGTP